MPGCTGQEETKVPVRRKRRRNGLGLLLVGMPEPRTRLPFHVLFSDLVIATGLSRTAGWPLNQNGLPAASRTSRTGTSVAASASGGGDSPLIGNVTVWKP